MKNVTDRVSNPFGMEPPCERYVPGYGDANAHFHVVGDHPGRHGGAETGVPFTNDAGLRLQQALQAGGLLHETGDEPVVDRTFLSYLHMCVPDDGAGANGEPTERAYGEMEAYFDAELRAIAAHVLLPVGERATRHVLATCTAVRPDRDLGPLWFTEVRGGGWLVIPVTDPTDWDGGDDEDADEDDDGNPGSDHDRLVDALTELQRTDYRRESDLGRFLASEEPYFVR